MAVSWLKKGKEAHAQVDAAEQETAKKKAAASVRRFWCPKEVEKQITFLDGDLDADGLLETVTYWEHNLKLNGQWGNYYSCTQDLETCPICQGDDTPALVAGFTIIDHSEWVDKQNKTHKNERKPFICKRETFKRLQKLATKRGGLAGCTFDVSRTGDKSAAVGSDFDFVEKRPLDLVMSAYSLEAESVTPLDYEAILVYRDADELRKLGFGTLAAPIGAADVAGTGSAPTANDYGKNL